MNRTGPLHRKWIMILAILASALAIRGLAEEPSSPRPPTATAPVDAGRRT